MAVSLGASPEGRDVEGSLVAGPVDEAVGPALGDNLVLGPKAHAFLPILADVAEAGALPPAEAVVAYRHRDRDVDADHADIHARSEFASRVAVPSEDGDAVAILVLRRELQRRLEIGRADHLQHGPEDLVLVGLHIRRHVIEEGRADEEAFLMALQLEPAAVDDELGALVDAHLDVVL